MHLLLSCFKMALSARLCARSLLALQNVRPISVSQCHRKVVMQPKLYQPPQIEGHDEKNMRLCRPQSPHVTIYKFQLPAYLSITHRITGVALYGYVAGIGFTSLVINKPMAEFITSISTSYPTIFLLFKLGLVFPFTYHFFNGIRHLVWDTGNSLSLKGVYKSGYIMLAAALVSVWDTGTALTMKGVYISGYIMLLVSIITAGGLLYYADVKKQEEIERLRKKAEEAARLAAEKVKGAAKGKKK